MAYRAKHGPIATAPKLELHLANLQAMVANALGGKAKPQEFLLGVNDAPQQSNSGIGFDQAVTAFKTMGALK